MTPTLYLDQDGVLCDAVRGTFAYLGRSLPIRDVRWRFVEQVGLTDATFWPSLPWTFWADLSPTPECFALVDAMEELFGERICILTTLSLPPGPLMGTSGVDGKLLWVRHNLPRMEGRVFVGKPKHLLAGPGKILLDDHDENVRLFVEHGGKALLAPRPWNARRDECDDEGGFDLTRLIRDMRCLMED